MQHIRPRQTVEDMKKQRKAHQKRKTTLGAEMARACTTREGLIALGYIKPKAK